MKVANIYNYYSSSAKMEKAINMVKKILPIDCKYNKNLSASHSQTFSFCTLEGNPYDQHQIYAMIDIIQGIIQFCKD